MLASLDRLAAFAASDVLADRFELSQRLGAGGLAEVYAAHDRLSGAEVAVKILHAHLAGDADLAARFRREMAVTRALDHPGIVRVFDLHEHEGRPFFSMELLAGRTLHELLVQDGPLQPADARRVAREICRALQAAHRAGVVHRDLKPQNVFITSGGGVKLLDFGLARVAGQTRMTSQTAVLGTPGYIAPELLAGQRADARADLYGLGATHFEMLTGRRPFVSSDPYGFTQREVRRDQPLDPRIAPGDEALLRRALDSDPEQRYLDAAQMLRALEGETVPRPPATPPPMSAGEYDVLVHNVVRPLELLEPRPPIARVLDRLGAQAGAQWKLRLLGAGQAVLVSGASRRTAEAAASLCAEHGLPATVRPMNSRPRSEEWLAGNGGWLLAVLCAFAGALFAVVFEKDLLLDAGLGALAGYLLSWGLRPPASVAPLSGLPAQDSSMARLAEGISRRSERLQRERGVRPQEQQHAIDDLVSAAREAAAVARNFTEAAPAQLSLRGSALQALDLLTSRLLEIAAALDDALAMADEQLHGNGALRRLLQDVEVARQVLPELHGPRCA